MFNQVLIIGVGLMGGSLGFEIKRRKLAKRVIGFGRTRKNLKIALRKKCIDGIAKNLSVASDADFIILGTPVLTLEAQIKELAQWVSPGTILMDVGSTKEHLISAAKFLPKNVFYVGAHPMAGTELSGAKAMVPGLFENKKCVITPSVRSNRASLGKIKRFWKRLGSQVVCLSAKKHDRLVAYTSHLPQMAAFSMMGALKSMPIREIRALAGGGLKDISRIASSPALMWHDIAIANQKNLVVAMKAYQREINNLIALLEAKDSKSLLKVFEQSAQIRKKL